MPLDKLILIWAKALSLIVIWLTIAFSCIRIIIPSLWGSGNDIGLIAAPVAGSLSILLLAYLAVVIFKLINKDLK